MDRIPQNFKNQLHSLSSENSMSIRSPICTLLAHVDHGKTSILDKIRGSAVAAGEAGGITQAIGASIIPFSTIKKLCGNLMRVTPDQQAVPGILFIDSPGHEAFSSLRKRGGSLADIAILVIDINEGIKPQTAESIEILRECKTPFVVAANKVDLITGWPAGPEFIVQKAGKLSKQTLSEFETKLYSIVGQLQERGFSSDRFDRVSDYTRQIAVVPTSAKFGDGIPELLMVIIGLAQKYLEKNLQLDTNRSARGTILELKEEKGLGTTLDVIIYDGHMKVDDTLIFGTVNEPQITKIRSLLQPLPLHEMRDAKSKFTRVDRVDAATGVKIVAPNLSGAVAGMPIVTAEDKTIEQAVIEIKKDVAAVLIETTNKGVVVKADTLGSLEAIICMLNKRLIPIKRAGIGDITKKDMADAEANLAENPLLAVVLGFNVQNITNQTEQVHVLINNIIYGLLDSFDAWQIQRRKEMEARAGAGLVRPAKMEIMKNYIFRQNNPAVVGVDVLAGTINVGMPVMTQKGEEITQIKGIQENQKSVQSVDQGKQVAVSLPKVTVGRQIHGGDILYSAITEDEFRTYKDNKALLTSEEKGVLKEIARIRREKNPVWGI